MDDFDQYFDDDDFDDQTLAALDQVEKRLFEEIKSPAVEPPPKRQKTDGGWNFAQPRPATGAQISASTSFDLDELPEISLCQNTYAFQQLEGLGSPSLTPQAQNNKESEHDTRRVPVASASKAPIRTHNAEPSRVPNPVKLPPAPAARRSTSNPHQPSSRSTSNRIRNPSRLLEHITSALSNPSSQSSNVSTQQNSVPRPPATRHNSNPIPVHVPDLPPPPPPPPAAAPVSNMSEQVDQVKKQLEEMRAENERIRLALKQAEDDRTAKSGEVAVLRRGIKQTAQEHATQMAKLREAKDEADAKQTSMQREMKDAMERLKTEFAFKQHELESSHRKAPMSAVARKSLRDLPGSTQSPRWGSRGAGTSTLVKSTPVRTMPSVIRPQIRSPEKERRSAMLPGFENSFMDSTPKRQPGKVKAPNPPSPEIPVPSTEPLFANELKLGQPSNGFPASSQIHDEDVGMEDSFAPAPMPRHGVVPDRSSSPMAPEDNDDEDVDMDEEEEIIDEIEHFNWKAELARVVLTHTHPLSSRPTLQSLAEQSPLVSGASEEYISHISRVLEVIASTSTDADYDRAVSSLIQCFISISNILNASNLIPPLIHLLNLMGTLIYSLPSFISEALSQCHGENDDRAPALVLLCDIIQQHLAVPKHSEHTPLLANEVLSLIEALCWRTPENRTDKLEIVPRNQEVLMVLLNNSQPTWFLARATRLLALMSIYPNLARSLLSLPQPGPEEAENQRASVSKIPQLDRLCSFIIDSSRRDDESDTLKSNVLTIFTILSQVHSDSLAALISSNAAIPALILYLTNLSTPIWEEAEALLSSPPLISSTIKSLNQTTYLLHHLIFSVPPEVGLRAKLQHAPHRPFNGITHMFIVTFGRLSYAPIPEWIDPNGRYELSAVRDMARDLLELVVDGPEGDSVYAAYQDDEEDEGEMEEQFLGDE